MTDPQNEPAAGSSHVAVNSAAASSEVACLEVAAPPAPAGSPPPVSWRKRGPGLWESVAWMLGFFVVQIGASLLAVVFLVATYLFTGGGHAGEIDATTLMKSILPFMESNLVVIVGAAELAMVMFGLAAIRLRFGAGGLRELGFHRPWIGHWLLVALLMPPLLLLGTVLQAQMFRWFPNAHREMEQLMRSMAQAPLSILVLVIGLGPALAEELLFRGLIGRGFLARYGLIVGIFLTSVMFGVMHINPGQAIGVIPIGLALHFVYYTTRSFWAPVTLHLFNNALAAVLLKNGDSPAIARLDQAIESQGGPPVSLLVASAAMVTAIAILLWQTRVQYVLRDGTIWSPGYATACAPPVELGARPMRQEPRFLMLAGGTFNSLGFAAGLWRLTDWAGLPW